MKKLMSMALALCLVLSVAAVPASAAHIEHVGSMEKVMPGEIQHRVL